MWTGSHRPARVALALGILACALASSRLRAGDDAATPSPRLDDASQVNILDGQGDGQLEVTVRGNGADRVKFTIANRSGRRLNVVLPPGLVAASGLGQPGGLGGGFQSMGLGLPTDQPGRFGRYTRGSGAPAQGFRSVDTVDQAPAGVIIPADETVEVVIPSVCLNFGAPTPTARNVFRLVDVDTYTTDVRARKALRNLATLGTSQGVAQVVAWHVFNNMTLPQIAQQGAKYVNPDEVSVASRFIDALDSSSGSDVIDPAYFQNGRILVRLEGQGSGVKAAARVRDELSGVRLLGLPIQVVDELSAEHAQSSVLLVDVQLLGPGSRPGQSKAKASVRHNSALGGWTRLGTVDFTLDTPQEELTGELLAADLDRAIAGEFVTATPARRNPGMTTLRVVNRLPFTLQNVQIRTSRADDAPIVTLEDLGVGPRRSAMATVAAPLGLVERVELNGL